MARILNEIEIADMIQGATILGTGGGGDPSKGWEYWKTMSERGGMRLVDPEDMPRRINCCLYIPNWFYRTSQSRSESEEYPRRKISLFNSDRGSS